MLTLGCHMSVSKGFVSTLEQAIEIGASTFAFFTRNPRGSQAKAIDHADSAAFVQQAAACGFGKLVAHGAYTMNLCTKDPEGRAFAASLLEDDLFRMSFLPGNYYNFHPGSHVGQGLEAAVAQIAQALRSAMRHGYPTTVLLETMAGKGSEVGGRFEELRMIMDAVADPSLGVCLDTCHVYDGGYDIANDLNGVLAEFDRVIGLKHLKALHINDSKNPFLSHKDRHACIGEGSLGVSTFAEIVRHPVLQTLPMILETPNELPGYAREIALLKTLA